MILLVACQSASETVLPTLLPTAQVNIITATQAYVDTSESAVNPVRTTPTHPYSKSPTPSVIEPTSTVTATSEPSPIAVPVLTPTLSIEPTPTYWPTVTRQVLPDEVTANLVPCNKRTVEEGLMVIATQQFELPPLYVPSDLVLLTDYFPSDLTRGQELYAKAIIIDPLQQMVNDMHSIGLRPSILSAYRDYNEQALAWLWWNNQYPERVAIMSARPGQSEHQLGTAIDFGSPEINHLFHVDFATTPEGDWLMDNAHLFGFTLSYPEDSYEITGFKYEPWHYRYVGVEMATHLFNSGQILTQWQIENLPPPCIP